MKIDPVDPAEIALLNLKKEITEGKNIARSESLPSGLKNGLTVIRVFAAAHAYWPIVQNYYSFMV